MDHITESECGMVCECVYVCVCKCIDNHNSGTLSRNGGPALCSSSFGTLPHLDPERIQPKTDGTAENLRPFNALFENL